MLLLLLGCTNRFPSPEEVWAEAHARFDGDHDGVLTRAEYDRFDPLPDTFDKMDRSKDGNVDVEEFKYYVLSNQPRALVSRKGMAPK